MKFFAILFLLVASAGFFAVNLSLGVFNDLFLGSKEQEVLEVQEVLKKQDTAHLLLEEAKQAISLPSPLKIFGPASSPGGSVSLSAEGVLQWTNTSRQTAGLPMLEKSFELDQIAQRKVEDMFARQYFAHVSPVGLDVGDLAEGAGYQFIAIGENLALGNYESDQALVQAWMDSPGHRENILGIRYQEIGIALQKGLYEGNSTWLAVQTFALPLSACDFPDKKLQGEIELGKIQIGEIGSILEQLRGELESEGPKGGPGYEKKIREHNMLVDQYNALAGEIQAKIAQYNIQAQIFNECAT